MLNKQEHKMIMGKILGDIYSDTSLSVLLGFKGGTCAYFFYDLPRFSVDLDFDLLSPSADHQDIFNKIISILKKYGKIKDSCIKHFTIFAVLSYGDADHNIKVEINIREADKNIRERYEIREGLGISMLAAKKDYMLAAKLAALTSRSAVAMRDVYDIYYFSKNNWDIDAELIKQRVGKEVIEYLSDCVAFIEKIKDSEILRGLGELIDEKEKDWVRKNLKAQTIFMLKNYIFALKK